MSDFYRQAVDAAIAELDKPLADLTGDEQEELAERAIDYLVGWDVFRVDSAGRVRGGGRLLEANRVRDYPDAWDPVAPDDVPF